MHGFTFRQANVCIYHRDFFEGILGVYLAVFVIQRHFQTPVFTHSIYTVFLLSLLLLHIQIFIPFLKISWNNPEKNKEVLNRVEKKGIYYKQQKEGRKAKSIFHILCRNCLLKHAIERNIEGRK